MSLIWPLKKIHITQQWGKNPDWYKRFGIKGHNGLDLRAPTGTPVYSPHDGVIKERRFDSGYGNYLKVESKTEGSVLAHLSRFAVGINKHVKKGDLIGYSGNTGNSTGPHLHWGYYKLPRNRNDGYLGYINQESLVDSGEDMSDIIKVEKKDWERARKSMDVLEDVHDYLELDGDHIDSGSDPYKNVIGGYKSQATAIRRDLAKCEQEVKNRKEQVSRLEDHIDKLDNDHKKELVSINSILQETDSRLVGCKIDVDGLTDDLNDLYKEKGRLQNELAVATSDLEECRKGNPTQGCWEIFINNVSKLFRRK